MSPKCMAKIDLQKAYATAEWIYLKEDFEGFMLC